MTHARARVLCKNSDIALAPRQAGDPSTDIQWGEISFAMSDTGIDAFRKWQELSDHKRMLSGLAATIYSDTEVV